MLKNKRIDLDAEKRKKLLREQVEALSQSDADLYYRSTSDIAAQLKKHIDLSTLSVQQMALVGHLTQRDIEVLLSHH